MRPAGQFHIIASVDEQARYSGVVDCYAPATCAFHHEQVGNDGLADVRSRFQARLGIVSAKLPDHVSHVFIIYAADALSLRPRAAPKQFQIIAEPRHGGILALRFSTEERRVGKEWVRTVRNGGA